MKFRPKIDRIEYGGCLIGLEEVSAVMNTMLNQGGRRWTIGPESTAFENEVAQKVRVKGGVVVNSGSSALLVGISALHLPEGSKVIIPALNFPTAYSSLLQNNLIPVVIDCDLKTLNLSFTGVKEAIEKYPDIKAVVAVHVAGNCVDLPKLREIVGDRYIISDNCDGLGGTLNGKYIDTYSDISCVSFHAAHIISMGEGGMVLSDNEEILARARKMREWGRASGSDTITKHKGFPADYRERYVFEEIGYNMKPLELQCAMGRVQLRKLDEFKEKRGKNYLSLLPYFKKNSDLVPIEGSMENCWFSFPFLCAGVERKKFMENLENNNIECRTIFSGNILRHPAYKNKSHIVLPSGLKNSDYVMERGMFVSTHPHLTDEMIEFIGECVGEVCN